MNVEIVVRNTKRRDLVKRRPVARFYYQGNHSHPVRRTVLVTRNTALFIEGYELRDGNEVSTFANAPLKLYVRNLIATMDKLGPCNHRQRGPSVSSLRQETLEELIRTGP